MILKILYGFDRISQERNENQQIFAVIDKKMVFFLSKNTVLAGRI